jgi:hypothetical protein
MAVFAETSDNFQHSTRLIQETPSFAFWLWFATRGESNKTNKEV